MTSAAKYVGAAVLVALVFLALYLFFVRTQAGQSVDQLAYDGAAHGRRSVTALTQRLLDGLPTVSVVLGLALTIVVSVVRRKWTNFLVAVGAAVAATEATQLLKDAMLSRPELGVVGFASNSFPSGHTTVAAASALAVFLVASPRTRSTVGVGGAVFAVAAGVSTLADQWHRPSDVIAGLLVVAFWGCIGGAVLARVGPDSLATPSAGSGGRWWIAILFVIVTAASFLITFLHAAAAPSGTLIAYIGGGAAIIATGLVISLAATRLFARLP